MHIEQKTNRIFRPTGNTTLSAEESNQVTTELENLITAGNLTPSAGTLTQVRDAVQNVVNVAKNDLQEQIDAITSASDVFDVVGTYAQLQAYDTSTVPVNDIIKVLQDETRNNAMTYYRWNGTSWVFIGAEGPYYTVAEVDQTFATKAQLPGIATTQQVGLVKPDGQTTIVQQDGTLSVSSNVAASLPLFTPIWADHILNNASYLRADTFSWQSGNVYISAYQHLVDDVNGITSETETVAGTTITFYRATDGHKIVLADQESNVSAIYTATGVAWYYILDTTNQRFKLPRNIYGFTGYRGDVGGYVEESLPSFVALCGYDGQTGAYRQKTVPYTYRANTYQQNSAGVADIDATYGSEVANKEDAPVQQRATQAYLYFYVGNTVQNETSVDVAEMTEAINDKVDLSSSWGTLSTTYDNLTEPSNNGHVDITAPADGWLYYARRKSSGDSNTNMWAVNISHTEAFQVEHDGYWGGTLVSILFPVKKGNTIRFGRNNLTGDFMGCRFYYAQKTN